jgi:hypothetical protein
MNNVQPAQHSYVEKVVPFLAGDGMALNLINVRNPNHISKGPVILVHGAGVRANIYRAPVKTTIVDALIEEGYDVWLENWRASIDLKANKWTLDQAAVFDHPAAVNKILQETGANSLKAIIHCQGSTSFAMSAVAGLVPAVDTIVSNAVSLHPIVPDWSATKLRFMVPLVAKLTEYLNPQWGLHAPNLVAKSLRLLVNLTHHECDNPVCKQVSFVYGSGCPALWRHENINDETHTWLQQEFAEVPMLFFKQIRECVLQGFLSSVDNFTELPASFVGQAPKTEARFAFLAGAKNLCFLPESQVKSHAFMCQYSNKAHSLHIFPEYSHLDVFMGKDAVRDTFPTILAELAMS